ncbi:MAG: hypothetical protein GC164_13430 [Phycisphaera sp.]|nr:hypothetical protein [Phycisphaera sp.]
MPAKHTSTLLMAAFLGLASCGDDSVKTYRAPSELAQSPAVTQSTPNTAPVDSPVTRAEPSSSPITWTLPGGWVEESNPAPPRLATITITEDERKAELAVTRFPSGMDLVQNLNRWRGQFSLPAIQSTSEQPGTQVHIADGSPATIYKFESDTSASFAPDDDPTGLVAIIPHDGLEYYLKLTGPRKLVNTQEENFRGFVGSVKFSQ